MMGMSWIEASFSHLEARLREFFEGEGRVDGIPKKFHKQLSGELFQAMKSGLRKAPDERGAGSAAVFAPDQYTLLMPIAQAQQVLEHPSELDRLSRKLESLAAESGILFHAPPIMHVVADPAVEKVRVVAGYSRHDAGDSYTIEVAEDGNDGSSPGVGSLNAFLIVNGLKTHPLTRPVVNLGRDSCNDIHLDDARVSRLHAQLRLIRGRYVIFDLDSTGGTLVNGVAVSSQALKPGDVITLAGLPLVYGVEAEENAGYTQKLPAEPLSPEVL